MRTGRSPRRGRRLAPSPARFAPCVLATAVLATGALCVTAGHPVAAVSAATTASIENQAAAARAPVNQAAAAESPGWRVVRAIGPRNIWVCGFDLFYHLTGGRWTEVDPPAGVFDHVAEDLTWIPGTHSLWGTVAGLTSNGNYGVLIKYGPL